MNQNETFKCLYCWEIKNISESTLEHAIPQFMGGNFAPNKFKLKNVCKDCNSNLGLFVDGAFARSRDINTELSQYDDLISVGVLEDLKDFSINTDYIAEFFLGPCKEPIVWLRPKDIGDFKDRAGGNPRERKSKNSVLYIFKYKTYKDNEFQVLIDSILKNFNFNKIKKYIVPYDEDDKSIDRDKFCSDLNLEDVEKIRELITNPTITLHYKYHPIRSRYRFMFKLLIGLGYSFFQENLFDDTQSIIFKERLWIDYNKISLLDYEGIIDTKNESLYDLNKESMQSFIDNSGYSENSYVLMLLPNMDVDRYAFTLNLNKKIAISHLFVTKNLSNEELNPDKGYVLILFPALNRYVELTTFEFENHRTHKVIHPELAEIDLLLNETKEGGYE